MALIRGSKEAGDEQDHHHVYALFLAGILASSAKMRTQIRLLLDQMRGVGLPGSVDRVLLLMESLCDGQSEDDRRGRRVPGDNWFDVTRITGKRWVVIGI